MGMKLGPPVPLLSQGPHPGRPGDGESQHPWTWERFLLQKKYGNDLETGSGWI